MSYKLAGEDEKTFKIRHKDGSDFHVSKAHIGPEMESRIRGLEVLHLADGGEVTEEDEPKSDLEESEMSAALDSRPDEPKPILPPEPAPMEAQGPVAVPQIRTPANVPAVTGLEQPPVVQQPVAVPPPVPAGSQVADDLALKAIDLQRQAGIDAAKAQAAGAASQAQTWDQYAKQLSEVDAKYKPQEDALNKENQDLHDAIANQKIDPNRLWNNMSTGNKILASLSIALGGLGAGLQGRAGQNVALDVIQKEIDRDIDAQVKELGKKQTLYSENLRRLGDERAAKASTKAQLISVAQAQANAIAARSGSAVAMAQMKSINAQADMQKAQLNREAAMFGFKQQILGGGGREGGIPVSQENPAVLEKIIPDYSKKRVVIGDKAYVAGSERSAELVGKMEPLYKQVQDEVSNLQKLYKDGTLSSATMQRGEAKATMNRLAFAVNALNGNMRFSELNKDMIEKMFSDPTSLKDAFMGRGETAETLKALSSKMESVRKQNIPGYKGVGQYSTFKPGV